MPSGGLPGGVPKQVPCLPPLSLYLQGGDVGGEEEARLEHNGPLGLSPPFPPLAGPPGIKEMRIRESAGGRAATQTDRAATGGRRGRWDLRISHTPMFVHTFFLGMEARSSDQAFQ